MLETMTNLESSFQLRGSLFTLSVLQINHFDLKKINRELKELTIKAPKFFDNAPIVIDLQKCQNPDDFLDFAELKQLLQQVNLIPVGIKGGNPAQQEMAKSANLPILSTTKIDEPNLASANSKKSATKKEKIVTNLLVTKPVRGGQQLYAKQGDLIIVGDVNHGAELLADGSIHIYGALRGRALAGINGNEDARIFCQSMEAELVSVAGRYIVNDNLIKYEPNIPQQIYLHEGKLIISAL